MRIFWRFILPIAVIVASYAQGTGLLKVRVLDGDGSFNDIRNGVGHGITVEVRDQNNQAVEGAEVTFIAPSTGPSGTFANGTSTEVVMTNGDGLARSAGLTPNSTEGRLIINVVVRSQNREGAATVGQSNTAAGRITVNSKNKNKSKKKPELVEVQSLEGRQ